MITIGITMGCPVGVGPEIILRAFAADALPKDIQPVIVGDIRVLKNVAEALNISLPLIAWNPGDICKAGQVHVYTVSSLDPNQLVWGQPCAMTGAAMAQYIEAGVSLVQRGILHGLATCPISKAALKLADYPFPGHTEMLAHLTNASEYAMMMAGKTLKITLVTIHCPLRTVASALSMDAVFRMIALTNRSLITDFGINAPRLAVAGLNPHAGEGGLFGDEEERIIMPAINRARQERINVTGPYPPDTVYFRAAAGEFDAVVSMYHDQGLIPFKLLHFHDGVNVTIGLPIVRTSVDHGTAYDIAGKGVASFTSLVEAVRLAGNISKNREAFTAGSAKI